LIELLIVIAIVAVLAVTVILVLNPAQLLKQARDSTRLSDLASLNKALTLYQTDQIAGNLGSSSVIYVSIPDPSATTTAGTQCQGLGLSTSSIPPGWQYHCAASSTYKNPDGNGWVPVNFSAMSAGSPVSQLSVDPVNTSSTGQFYAYVPGGSWKLSGEFESDKFGATAGNDGGVNPALFETGTDLALAPFLGGLVGWWEFDEASGTAAYASSGLGNNGTLGAASSTLPQWSSGKIGTGSLLFNSNVNYVNYVFVSSTLPVQNEITYSAWINRNMTGWIHTIIGQTLQFRVESNNKLGLLHQGSHMIGASTGTIPAGTWTHVAITYNKASGDFAFYINGQASGSGNYPETASFASGIYIGAKSGLWEVFSGYIDDVRIYNRVLSAAEIQATYNATK
jgi:type II secretory pathway pseudopilin PulG